jgi:hypothetical protein
VTHLRVPSIRIITQTPLVRAGDTTGTANTNYKAHPGFFRDSVYIESVLGISANPARLTAVAQFLPHSLETVWL